MRKKDGGFTLVELLVTIACSSLVTLAAMSLLLVSMRVDRSAQDTASRQSDTRIILTMLQNAAGTGGVERLETVGEDWTLFGGGDEPLLRYSAGDGAVKTGGGTVMMDGVEDSSASLAGRLLTLSLTTADGEYETSVYCRTGVSGEEYDAGELAEAAKDDMNAEERLKGTRDARYELLTVLASQFSSGGEIKDPPSGSGITWKGTGDYFSEWYLNKSYGGGYDEHSSWNKDTPWCACFLSWAVAQLGDGMLVTAPLFADVDDGMKKFQTEDEDAWGRWLEPGTEDDPLPCDFIFFDWDGDSDPDHVGAVMLVRDGTVYTIEGNSGGKVAVHSYSRNDACVMGYGLLKWIKLQQGL